MVFALLKSVAGRGSDDLCNEVGKEIDMFNAIRAHIDWKLRLHNYMDGQQQTMLDHEHICKDDLCELGKWLHGNGKQRFGQLPLFQELIIEHAKFHRNAARVVEAIHDGDKEHAKVIMRGEYAQQSKKTVAYLMELNAKLNDGSLM